MLAAYLYRSRRNFGLFVRVPVDGTAYTVKLYRKYVKGVEQYGPLVAGLSWTTDKGYLVTIEADGYIDISHRVLAQLDVYYYRLYIACDGNIHVHLIAGPPTTKSKALKLARPYTDKKHIRLRTRLPDAGVVRITPLPCEEDLMLYVDGPVKKILAWLGL